MERKTANDVRDQKLMKEHADRVAKGERRSNGRKVPLALKNGMPNPNTPWHNFREKQKQALEHCPTCGSVMGTKK